MIPAPYDKYASHVTVGCVNFRSIWGDKAANLEKIKRFIVEGALQGVDILVFPELCLSGYEADEKRVLHSELAETIPGPSVDVICELAAEHNMYVTFGMPERDSEDKSVCYIACPFIGPEGLIGTYRKLHLGRPPMFTESECFKGGDAVPVFETRFGPVGVLICVDFWNFPELARILMLKGARLILNSTASMDAPGRPEYITQQTGARATENVLYTASANLAGKENTKSFYGHSTIAGPSFPRFNYIYAQAGYDEELISATLSFEKLHRFRDNVQIDKIRRDDVIMAEFEKLNSNRN
jgi:predicted amidohydrolase